MRRDQQQDTAFKPGRHHARKEWGQGGDEQHQMEAREHARQPGKTLRTHGAREAEAQRQIRELGTRD